MKRNIWFAIAVSALGYFVDVYDLVLFNVVRVKSLQSFSLSPSEITSVGIYLLNIQLVGLLIGGLFWGTLGDKKGRVSVLFGSILLYSCANIANAFVTDITSYSICRFLAGIGLGGEFGIGVTLVSELLPKNKRGYGGMIVAATGALGAITSGLIGDLFSWRTSYIVGGFMGFLLLGLRVSLSESEIFSRVKATSATIQRGSLKMLLGSPELLSKYLQCIFIGTPIWITIGLFMALSPEIAQALNIAGPISAGRSILFFNIGFGLGDILSSLLSQYLRSRRRAVLIHLLLTAFFSVVFLCLRSAEQMTFYSVCALLGIGAGYWAIFMMVTAEQFGTNLRATVATSVPNLVRVLVVPCSLALTTLKTHLGLIESLALIQFVVISCAMFSRRFLAETFSKDLNFVEK